MGLAASDSPRCSEAAPGVGWAVEGWSLPERPQHQQVLLAVQCLDQALAQLLLPACPKAVARRAHVIQWAWMQSSLPVPGCPLPALHFELGTLSLFWSPGPEHLLAGLRRSVATAVSHPQAGPKMTTFLLALGSAGPATGSWAPQDTPTFGSDCLKAVRPHAVMMPPC